MKLTSLSLATLVAFSAQFVQAEVKPVGTVLSTQCGYVDLGQNPFVIESTPKQVCVANVVGSQHSYVTVAPHLGETAVYLIVPSAKPSAFGPVVTHMTLKYFGVIEQGRLVKQEPQYGYQFDKATLVYGSTRPGATISSISLARGSDEPIVAKSFQIMFHTMAAVPAAM